MRSSCFYFIYILYRKLRSYNNNISSHDKKSRRCNKDRRSIAVKTNHFMLKYHIFLRYENGAMWPKRRSSLMDIRLTNPRGEKKVNEAKNERIRDDLRKGGMNMEAMK